MKLSCLIDNCPLTGNPTDMRRCCGISRSLSTSCSHYGAEPWSEFGHVTCNHPKAKAADAAVAEANREAFKATAPALGHILYCTT